MLTTNRIDRRWSDYDKSVAVTHLANYGVIYLDQYGCPIDDEYELEELDEKRKLGEWKKEALWYILRCKKWMDSPYRQNREYASYLKHFFFGDGEIAFDGTNETWKMRKARKELPMPTNVYLYM